VSISAPASLSLHHISKRFGSVPVLQDISLEVRAGEMLALVGENGAGKSTLMNIMYGLYQPTDGYVEVNQKRVSFRSPADAMALGMGMVHQHFTIVPSLTALENIVLGTERSRLGLLDTAQMMADVQQLVGSLHLSFELSTPVADLTVGTQQKIEIVKALYRGAKVLLLDEPTAVLTESEVVEFFELLSRLRSQGTALVLVTHKLGDVFRHADRVAVLRGGKKVAQSQVSDTSEPQIAAHMLGEGHVASISSPVAVVSDLKPRLQLHHATAPRIPSLNLTLRAGEIVGLAGVDGNGQTEVAELLAGLAPLSAGRVLFDQVEQAHWNVARARALGVAHVPEDRQRTAGVSNLTVEENIALGAEWRLAKGPRIDFVARRAYALAVLSKNDVRPPEPGYRFGALSGGNQQKLVVGRETALNPRVLIAVQPTRGLDFNATAAVRQTLLAQRANGCAVLLVSLDLDEVLALSDRVAVMYQGRIVLERPRHDCVRGEIGQAMLGRLHA
jgi:general nucleoside transport system ATP-binding protein